MKQNIKDSKRRIAPDYPSLWNERIIATPNYPKNIKATKKVIKQDHRRISKEAHEIAYVRKLAREILNAYNHEKKFNKGLSWNFVIHDPKREGLSRVCKALLKFTKGYTK